MKSVQLRGTNIVVSRFIFGTASLHHVGNPKSQVAHLRAAADAGFRHFDTAPLYGFGQSEHALGIAFGSNSSSRLDVTLTTKVGLYPPGGADQSRVSMLVRKLIGKISPNVSRALADWSIQRATASLDQSLKRLQRDHIDILLLHEPDIEIINTDEWLRWMEYEASSRVRCFGICGDPARLLPFVTTQNQLCRIVQTSDSLLGYEADKLIDAGFFPQLTYGYLAANKQRCSVEQILYGALARNRAGAVVVSTRQRSRLDSFARIAGTSAERL